MQSKIITHNIRNIRLPAIVCAISRVVGRSDHEVVALGGQYRFLLVNPTLLLFLLLTLITQVINLVVLSVVD